MTPQNPDFETMVRASFARQSLMETMGGRIERVEPGLVEISYVRDEKLLQQHGFMHAGVATSLVDSACGYAALTLAPAGWNTLTAEFKINFLRPASGSAFRAVGRVMKAGKLVSVTEGEVWQDGEKLIAKMQATNVLQPE
ncbi:MAG: PaaI family thioesterase [Nitratireductor sp.]|nr:PaaI family thioesterase [Nitratireductor sp.]